jgi:hypothetical protein
MSFFADTQVLLERLATQMALGHPTVPMQMPGDIKEVTADLWCQPRVTAGDTKLVSIGGEGSRRYRTVGIFSVAIMLKPDGGNGQALTLADSIASYLRNWKSGNIRTYAPTVHDLGLSGAWYQVNVLVPYQSDRFF